MSREFNERDAIFNLQTYLRAQVLKNPSAPTLAVDGIFDDTTKNALIDFQLVNSLPPTGVADRATWDLLYSQYLEIIDENSLPDPIIPFPSYPKDYTIKRGEKSFLVAILQYMINEIGIIYNVFDTLEIDGEYGEATEKIVKDFQERNFLAPTGEVNRATWSALAKIYNLSLHYIDQY